MDRRKPTARAAAGTTTVDTSTQADIGAWSVEKCIVCGECKRASCNPNFLELHCVIYAESGVSKRTDSQREISSGTIREELICVAGDVIFRNARLFILQLLQINPAEEQVEVLVQVRGWSPQPFDELGDSGNGDATLKMVIGGLESEILVHVVLLPSYFTESPLSCSVKVDSGESTTSPEVSDNWSWSSCNLRKPDATEPRSSGDPRCLEETLEVTDARVYLRALPPCESASRVHVAKVLAALWQHWPQTVISQLCGNVLSSREISALVRRGNTATGVPQSRVDSFFDWYAEFLSDPDRYLPLCNGKSSCGGKPNGDQSRLSSATCDGLECGRTSVSLKRTCNVKNGKLEDVTCCESSLSKRSRRSLPANFSNVRAVTKSRRLSCENAHVHSAFDRRKVHLASQSPSTPTSTSLSTSTPASKSSFAYKQRARKW